MYPPLFEGRFTGVGTGFTIDFRFRRGQQIDTSSFRRLFKSSSDVTLIF